MSEKIEWVATYRDGTVLRQELNHPDLKYNGDMDTKQVKTYFFQQGDRIVCGVDVDAQRLIINGAIVHTNLPEGEYQLIAFKRVQVGMNNEIERTEWFCFGLQGHVEGKNYKQLVFVNPDGTYTLGDE